MSLSLTSLLSNRLSLTLDFTFFPFVALSFLHFPSLSLPHFSFSWLFLHSFTVCPIFQYSPLLWHFIPSCSSFPFNMFLLTTLHHPSPTHSTFSCSSFLSSPSLRSPNPLPFPFASRPIQLFLFYAPLCSFSPSSFSFPQAFSTQASLSPLPRPVWPSSHQPLCLSASLPSLVLVLVVSVARLEGTTCNATCDFYVHILSARISWCITVCVCVCVFVGVCVCVYRDIGEF